MKTTYEDKELEQELQELYILSKHWLHDISFIRDEIRFFKNILDKYWTPGLQNAELFKMTEFYQKIQLQEVNVSSLAESVQQYLKVLGPYVNDDTKGINVSLIEEFTGLQAEISTLFNSIRNTKKELFTCVEEILDPQKNVSHTFKHREAR